MAAKKKTKAVRRRTSKEVPCSACKPVVDALTHELQRLTPSHEAKAAASALLRNAMFDAMDAEIKRLSESTAKLDETVHRLARRVLGEKLAKELLPR